jgi:hypothetical protein
MHKFTEFFGELICFGRDNPRNWAKGPSGHFAITDVFAPEDGDLRLQRECGFVEGAALFRVRRTGVR